MTELMEPGDECIVCGISRPHEHSDLQWDETWGLVANEALACGRPIILADAVGAAPDLAADGSAGQTYPLGDIAALSRALRNVLASPPKQTGISSKSNAYSLEAAAKGVELAVASTLAKSRRTAGAMATRGLPAD